MGNFLFLICFWFLIGCSEPAQQFRVVKKIDVQKLDVTTEFKEKHKGHFLYYLAPIGEGYVVNSMIQTSNIREVYKDLKWSEVGDITEF